MDRLNNRRHRGMAIVEVALLLPILMLVLFGMIEYGGLFWRSQQLETAARNAARAGALPDSTTASVNAMVTSIMTANGLASTGYSVTLTPPNPATLAAGTAFTVTISVPYASITLTNVPLVPVPTTLVRSATMAKEGA